MIVKNESAHLGRCLESIADIADDIVVVDTGSSDGTKEIARRAGARVFDFAWVDDFAQARNYSLEQAQARWILVLDADEQLLERDRAALLRLLREEGETALRAFNLLQRNSSDGGKSGMLVRTLRVFPNRSDVRYENPVHEQVVQSLLRGGIQIVDAAIEIFHDGYGETAVNAAKQQRNLAILQRQIETGGANARTYFLKGGALMDLGNFEGAIATYGACIRSLPSGDELAHGARVRIAGCLFKLGRFSEACEWTEPSAADGSHHPESLLVRGRSLKALGDFEKAFATLCDTLAVKEAAFMPPCNLTSVKVEAVLVLAAILKEQGRNVVAVNLMRDVLGRIHGGLPIDAAWVTHFLDRAR